MQQHCSRSRVSRDKVEAKHTEARRHQSVTRTTNKRTIPHTRRPSRYLLDATSPSHPVIKPPQEPLITPSPPTTAGRRLISSHSPTPSWGRVDPSTPARRPPCHGRGGDAWSAVTLRSEREGGCRGSTHPQRPRPSNPPRPFSHSQYTPQHTVEERTGTNATDAGPKEKSTGTKLADADGGRVVAPAATGEGAEEVGVGGGGRLGDNRGGGGGVKPQLGRWAVTADAHS
ncbi:hypothetical protein I4F81_008147 [Pyropia yezoensis]|uniref:Uncharacterized protein n=1 Tax=Pyropia yezoensis TaxID=2788 RepID=A0ACC3C6V5_PYRYE|nr:hypothetical protein I4F81_008147 [Neopyropia yezoensis]